MQEQDPAETGCGNPVLAGFFKRGEYHMSASKQTAFDYIDEKAGVITDVSDKIWDYAELFFKRVQIRRSLRKGIKRRGIHRGSPIRQY